MEQSSNILMIYHNSVYFIASREYLSVLRFVDISFMTLL
jgi:hypothetical protein